MRLGQMFNFDSIPLSFKIMWERITLSRVTTAYFIFSVIHLTVQFSLQIKAFAINDHAANTLYDVISQGNATQNGFPLYDGNVLRICHNVPSTINASSCEMIWAASSGGLSAPTSTVASSSSSVSHSSILTSDFPTSPTPSLTPTPSAQLQKTITVIQSVNNITPSPVHTKTSATPTPSSTLAQNDSVSDVDAASSAQNDEDDDVALISRSYVEVEVVDNTDGSASVSIHGFGYDDSHVVLSSQCLAALNWPVEILQNTKREDITFCSFQVFVVVLSIVALLNESIPHIIASMLTHMLATAWAGFQIYHSASFHTKFVSLTEHGACPSVNLLPFYWQQRGSAENAILALNVFALLVSWFLSWRLIKLFGWQTFKRVGASLTINRIYKTVLTLSITMQLSVFFMASTLGLWIDQLFNGNIGRLAENSVLYKLSFTMTLVLLIPWLFTGWIGVRRELHLHLMVFLVLTGLYMTAAGVMFLSATFRWTFLTWRFFALITSGSMISTLVSFILGIVCRHNFGKGLSHHLNGQQPLDEAFSPHNFEKGGDVEKVEFPSTDRSIPSFPANFNSGRDAPTPSHMQSGPKSSPGSSSDPLEVHIAASITQENTHVKMYSEDSHQAMDLHHQDSRERDISAYSESRNNVGVGSGSGMHKKRWVIE